MGGSNEALLRMTEFIDRTGRGAAGVDRADVPYPDVTCARCGAPFRYDEPIRVGEDGLTHDRCPRAATLVSAARGDVRRALADGTTGSVYAPAPQAGGQNPAPPNDQGV